MAKLEIPVKVYFGEIDEMIKELRQLQTYKLSEGAEEVLVEIDDVARVLANHVKATTAESKQRWIPVSEKLPSFAQRVLVSTANYVYEAIYFDEDAGWSTYNVTFKDVEESEILAWMPLPEPYEEYKEEQDGIH